MFHLNYYINFNIYIYNYFTIYIYIYICTSEYIWIHIIHIIHIRVDVYQSSQISQSLSAFRAMAWWTSSTSWWAACWTPSAWTAPAAPRAALARRTWRAWTKGCRQLNGWWGDFHQILWSLNLWKNGEIADFSELKHGDVLKSYVQLPKGRQIVEWTWF